MSNDTDDPAGGDQSGRKSVIRHSSAAAAAGAVAVLSGILFDAVIAFTYGAGAASDAFFVAARIPLGIQAVLTVASNQALVPLFSTWMTKADRHEANRRVTLLATGAGAAGLILAVIGFVAAPLLMRITAPGLSDADIALATSVAQIMFFVIPLEAVGDVFEAYLNARYSFVVPSGAKVVRNVTAVAVILGFGASGTDPELIAWGYLIGMALLILVEFTWALTRGYRYVPTLALRDPHVAEAARLCTRPLISASINPLTRLVEQQFISFLPSGAITISQYGYRLISAIGGTVFFRAVVVALVPRLSEATTEGRDADVARLTRMGVRIMIAIALPLTALVAVLAQPAVIAVFERGRFTAEDATLLGWVLIAYSASLLGSGVQRAMLAPFFARLDTKTPLRNTIYGNAFNLALLPILLLTVGSGGSEAVVLVGVAFSAAQYVHVGHAWWHLHRIGIRLKGVGVNLLETLAATAAFAAALYFAARALGLYGDLSRSELLWRTALAAVIGVIPAGAVAFVTRKRLRRAGRARRAQAEEPETESADDPGTGVQENDLEFDSTDEITGVSGDPRAPQGFEQEDTEELFWTIPDPADPEAFY